MSVLDSQRFEMIQTSTTLVNCQIVMIGSAKEASTDIQESTQQGTIKQELMPINIRE